ncbi:MAG: hypothetical protein VX557_03980 [Candidatus Thermoplasmatota archaeon]|nr:hypothetical protein [Candidatus Thermoplasmatota archaeon]|tara:strand:+ start:3369 stop:3818 length:450 start_codon:yes stop_codon:yes gene_type:complete
MKDDVVMRLLREVKAGKVSVEDARVALEDASLTEESFEAAVNHGVFNEVKPGTIVRASLAPSGDSWLIIIVGLWGILWTLYWAGALAYGLYQEWDQQLLAFNLAMTLLTLIILGIVYLKYVLPDVVIVKHRRNKYITNHDTNSWKKYEV